jgi:hypothetical protein
MTTKTEMTLENLKVGAKFIRKTGSQFFTIGKEYLCEHDGYITNNDGNSMAVLTTNKAFNLDWELPFSAPESQAHLLTDTFTCLGCGHELPNRYSLRTKSYCYLCDPNITVKELLGTGQKM